MQLTCCFAFHPKFAFTSVQPKPGATRTCANHPAKTRKHLKIKSVIRLEGSQATVCWKKESAFDTILKWSVPLIKWIDTPNIMSSIFDKGDISCLLSYIPIHFWKTRPYLRGKDFLLGCLFRREQKIFWQSCLPWNVSFPLNISDLWRLTVHCFSFVLLKIIWLDLPRNAKVRNKKTTRL